MAAAVGAFPLLPNSNDIAMVLNLSSGVYTAHISSRNGGAGDVLFEIYEAPDNLLLPPVTPPTPPSFPAGSAPPTAIVMPPPAIDLPPVSPSGTGLF